MADRSPRFHVAPIPEPGLELQLSEAAANHGRVLRLRPGAELVLFDGAGAQALAELLSIDRQRLRCRVVSREVRPRPAGYLTLLLGLTKGSKPDLAVRMLTELGVDAISLVVCERSVVRDGSARLERLQQIAVEACAQSGNLFLPRIEVGRALLDAASDAATATHRVVFWERASPGPWTWPADASTVCAVVGPEGGLGGGEVERLCALGYCSTPFNTPILRAETAAVVAGARLLQRLRG